jgi:excinuclease ABC subunit B
MAEDLTEYLNENGLKVRYMHSDTDTIERIEIIRDLRLGEFDVLVGINLLREGLDIPECMRVCILDADKEGYLRSRTSLIQTIGRAARNSEARVILYADRETKSMKEAMGETARRREKQALHNIENGITPLTVKKEISDILGDVFGNGESSKTRKLGRNIKSLTEDLDLLRSPDKLKKHLVKLEKDMLAAAANLEFEEAGRLRDEISRLKNAALSV